ncbi:MAG TPA: hypothetical protein VES93_15945 [Ornithinibacter sp.]|nr:hypothetical protein [Ornithinibacter sp.]
MTEPTNDATNPTSPSLDLSDERRLAVELFNHTWDLIAVPRRTAEQDDAMIHAAHASRWHWGNAGGPMEWAVGEWMCSRVYAVQGLGEASLRHGLRSLALTETYGIGGYVPASAHEAIARAYAVAGDRDAAVRHRNLAAGLAVQLDDLDDRAVVDADLATLPLD